MAGEFIQLECPGCGAELNIPTREFVDVHENPEYKAQIIDGEFFMNECQECGDLLLVEYPLLYMDPDKGLNVYMAPEHDDDLLEQLNSLDIPSEATDEESTFRLVYNGVQLMEKILMAEKGRDDRILELYKFLIWDQVTEEWPDLEQGDLLYLFDEDGEYLVIWPSDNGDDEKLTIELDQDLYDELCRDHMKHVAVEPGKYAEVDQYWIAERFER